MSVPKPASGIQTFADGQAFIPSSKRADGSTRKEIKIRPGYKPPEDVEKYKSRTADTWRTRGAGSVPGAEDDVEQPERTEVKSKNAKRREVARKKKGTESQESAEQVGTAIAALSVQDAAGQGSKGADEVDAPQEDTETQKKIRNQLKKLKAIRELKSKKASGEKVTTDQLVKLSKEDELIRDLVKLGYNGPELQDISLDKATGPAG